MPNQPLVRADTAPASNGGRGSLLKSHVARFGARPEDRGKEERRRKLVEQRPQRT
jgi:hypothetical protein